MVSYRISFTDEVFESFFKRISPSQDHGLSLWQMMLRQEYHYLIAGLPELQFDEGKVTSTLLAFREELKQHLSASDYLSVHRLFLPYDNANLVGYLVSGLENFDPLGNYTPDSFAEQVNRIKSILPQKPVLEPYLVKFITNWLSEESGSNSVNPGLALTTEYYNENIAAASGFLKEWLIFNRNIKNIITALLCRNIAGPRSTNDRRGGHCFPLDPWKCKGLWPFHRTGLC
ncbi:MAG: DUF2764 family protein [Bacteroidales bacterium]